jgi:hypothetical protein
VGAVIKMARESVVKLYLFTNGKVIAFDKNNKQIPEITKAAMNDFNWNDIMLKNACEEATHFEIGKFNTWSHKLTKEEMVALLGVG